MLKTLRFALACLCLTGFCLLFLDPVGAFIPGLSVLAELQFVPALFSGSLLIVVILLGVTLLFGRVYCSVLCPLGSRFGKKRRFNFSTPKTGLRISMLLIFITAFVFGFPLIFGVLEPYGVFGRIAAISAMYLRQGAGFLFSDGSSFLYLKGSAAKVTALFTLAVIGVLALRYGRIWCNTICPVGTVLGYLSRFSLFQIYINQSECIGCGACEHSCPVKPSAAIHIRGNIEHRLIKI